MRLCVYTQTTKTLLFLNNLHHFFYPAVFSQAIYINKYKSNVFKLLDVPSHKYTTIRSIFHLKDIYIVSYALLLKQ